ncbi:MAG: GNAT family N-acetyltransferase [Caldilineaceae bacterium]|nr:GNAT family N-acetyltransferase [Caldilineaceae bacterium]
MSIHYPIQRSLHYIESHLTEPATVEQVAAIAGYSRPHFSRTFLACTGLTPTSYLRKRRLSEAARALVTSSQRILDIALDYQFGSQEAFTRSFKQEFGVSPGYYRRRGQLRRLWGKLSFGVTNLLYPGKGINGAPPLFVPEPTIVRALLVPRLRVEHNGKFMRGVIMTTPSTITIRPAHRQDIAPLCRLYHEFHEGMVQAVPQRLQSLGDYDYFNASTLSLSLQRLIDALDVAIWVAESSGEVVGLAEVYLREDEQNDETVAYRYGYLQSLMVTQRCRGQGIGAQLLAAAETWSREQGASELRLETWEFDRGPLGFYARQGYRTLRRTLVRSL